MPSLTDSFANFVKDASDGVYLGKCLKNSSVKIEEDYNKECLIAVVRDWRIEDLSQTCCQEIGGGRNLFCLEKNCTRSH